jgi:hypothetical protein
MADLAVGRSCPSCGTFTACAGSFNDPQLVGKCACCGANVIAAAHGGERAHAVRAAGAPIASQGGPEAPAPVVAPVAEAAKQDIHVPIPAPEPIKKESKNVATS